MKKNNEVTLLEILPKLNHIAKCYGLKLSSMSDFKIARTIWARSLSQGIEGIKLFSYIVS